MMKIKEYYPLKNHNTFGVEAVAKYFVDINHIDDIFFFISSGKSGIQPRLILGEGSNMLFTKDFEGIIVHSKLKGIEVIDEDSEYVFVRAAGGENWDGFVKYCVMHGYGGLENLSHIPGSVGASPVQNLGAYGVEAKDSIEIVEAIDLESGEKVVFRNPECDFGYRNSVFKHRYRNKLLITGVVFRLCKKHKFVIDYGSLKQELEKFSEVNIRNIRKSVIKIRNEKLPDPKVLGNAGSFFKNPEVDIETVQNIMQHYPDMPHWNTGNNKIKLSAAWLIEKCNWKGRKTGRTGTYKKQPLVIVNYGNATGQEISSTAKKIQKAVKNQFAISLEPEVNII